MPANLIDLTRQEKAVVAQQVHDLLKARLQAKGAEETLDGYIEPTGRVAGELHEHVYGKAAAQSALAQRVATLVTADVEVDTWYRHAEGYVSIEAHRHEGPHVPEALALYGAAWPDGLAHIDDPPVDENRIVRAALQALQHPAHAATVAAIGLPAAWLPSLASALDASEAAVAALSGAHGDSAAHVTGGRDAEAEFVSLMVRLRQYLGSRADSQTKEREGEALLRPLLDALKQKRAAAKSRATRKDHAAPAPAPTPTP